LVIGESFPTEITSPTSIRIASPKPTRRNRVVFSFTKKLISCFAARILLAYKEETKGGESMKIKVNVRAGGGKARA
jgi:hypothetical protein